MSTEILIYLVIHGVFTIGAIFAFFMKIEHRLTRVETKIENFEKRFK